MELNPISIQESTVFKLEARAQRQAERATPCGLYHEWVVVQESILYYDRKIVTEICLWCDTPQVSIRSIKHE